MIECRPVYGNQLNKYLNAPTELKKMLLTNRLQTECPDGATLISVLCVIFKDKIKLPFFLKLREG